MDGKIHLRQKEKDKAKDEILRYRDFYVLRFTNAQILKNLEWVMRKLVNEIEKILKKELP